MPDLAFPTDGPTRHNHFTRDIKPVGQCPACDEYWEITYDPQRSDRERRERSGDDA